MLLTGHLGSSERRKLDSKPKPLQRQTFPRGGSLANCAQIFAEIVFAIRERKKKKKKNGVRTSEQNQSRVSAFSDHDPIMMRGRGWMESKQIFSSRNQNRPNCRKKRARAVKTVTTLIDSAEGCAQVVLVAWWNSKGHTPTLRDST